MATKSNPGERPHHPAIESVAYTSLSMPAGEILVAGTERGICALIVAARAAMPAARDALQQYCPAPLVPDADALADAAAQLAAYVAGTRQSFDLPLDLTGTPFQRRVWEALRAIPAGETRSYREVAAAVGAPNGARAVAAACASNRVALVIPCHRVVREGGALAGYRWGAERKRALLEREGRDR